MHTKPAAKMKLVKRQLPRARKARARLRQNKQRAAAVRTN